MKKKDNKEKLKSKEKNKGSGAAKDPRVNQKSKNESYVKLL